MSDQVNHPPHYTQHPSGVEAVDIAEHLSFNLGNALKYVWRAKLKGTEVLDLNKALWYLERENRLVGSILEPALGSRRVSEIVRLNSQKALDKEGRTSALGKFLTVLFEGIRGRTFDDLMEIVKAELGEQS